MLKRVAKVCIWVVAGSAILATPGLWAQEETNLTRLKQLAEQERTRAQREYAEARDFALQRGLPVRQEYPDGTLIEIQRLKNGRPIYNITENADAAVTTRTDRLWPGGGMGLNLTGAGYDKLGEWDGGGVLTSHQEFAAGRVVQMDGPVATHYHATHVAGTMIATGVVAQATGMAYQGNLDAYEWNNDEAEMATAAAAGMEVSNHSYGQIRGWRTDGTNWYWYGDTDVSATEDYGFGFYSDLTQLWDELAYNAPYYLIFKSAGNDRDDVLTPGSSHYVWDNAGSTWVPSTASRDRDGGANGYDSIGLRSTAKNLVTVGAVISSPTDRPIADVAMSSFSGWGPCDDGRIKPDICAMGVNLYSTSDASDNAYTTMSGTSMASPNATGTAALLQQHYQDTHGNASMRASTLKALIAHTADEFGGTLGPDYRCGWGVLNAQRAAQKISEDGNADIIEELYFDDGVVYTRVATATGLAPLKVTIAWTDPAGTPVADAVDPPNPMLVNDMDLRVTRNGVTYYPWQLDRDDPAQAATRTSENDIDNVEQVVIDNPSPGTYTITVDHDGSLSGTQAVSIIISGTDEFSGNPTACASKLIFPANGATGVPLTTAIEWDSVFDATRYQVYFGTDGGGLITPTNIVNGTIQGSPIYHPDLAPDTTYYLQVIPRNQNGAATGCSTIWSFTTGSYTKIATFPYVEDFESFGGVGVGNGWKNGSGEDFDWVLNSGGTTSIGTGPDGDHTSGSGYYLYTEASSPNYPSKVADLYTPVFDLSGLQKPRLSFWYHMLGEDMGDLVVDLYGNGTWHYGVLYMPKQQSIDGSDWQEAVIDLSPYKSGTVHGMRFRVVTNGWKSDVAIDDIRIFSGVNAWLGYTSDWHSTGNWSLGTLPDPMTWVMIPASPVGGEFPVCGGMPEAAAEKITLEGGPLTLSAGVLELGNA